MKYKLVPLMVLLTFMFACTIFSPEPVLESVPELLISENPVILFGLPDNFNLIRSQIVLEISEESPCKEELATNLGLDPDDLVSPTYSHSWRPSEDIENTYILEYAISFYYGSNQRTDVCWGRLPIFFEEVSPGGVSVKHSWGNAEVVGFTDNFDTFPEDYLE